MDLVAQPVHLFFSVASYRSSKTASSWFLKAESTVLYSSYIRLYSVCSLRVLFSSVGGVHAGTCAVRPGSGGRTKAVPET